MKIGYARISTLEQNLDLQIDALNKAGCEKIITDKISGSVAERPGLEKLKEILRKNDTLVVWRLDRLGRTLKHLIEWVHELDEQNIGFKSLQESIDTTSSSGKLIFHIFGALSEFERNLIRERTRAGVEAARARGRQGGRPKKLNKDKRQLAIDLYKAKKHSLRQICEMTSISKPTLYKYVREDNK
ncbi:recombinase family protein [Allofrancisella guangzhouensis]|uniref:Transposon Tn552 DNA-invertase BinR n=4 Tax=Pseudomonadota TaxID=1224 RepID=A0A0A8E4V6_9GAMM|nr:MULTISPECIES: recombinase family protein [Pseudomonadota]AJC49033.1 transposon Tn552 DNA-invertase BinR [Allofrancisella guangzhouensis]MBK2044859.1 recombinase family protein [Allofrancisella guangzhouensis]MBK2046037.1 recombinase family protein [Allofrancisella guangzhouensis]MBK2046072.1 recombinase family protein [Allofrancisella guangzhouensis]MBK2046229.1 recombinase family protein [Allofrancisella guangzhouensis]